MNNCGRVQLMIMLLAATMAGAEPRDDGVERLLGLPRPWDQKIHRLTRGEYKETLRYWGDRHGDILSVSEPGQSVEGDPIYVLKITDSSIPPDDKQVIVIAAMHGGPERCGTTTLMHLAQWLLSDDAEAIETRQKQVVLVMPIVNPYAFFVTDDLLNSNGIDPYTGGQAENWDLATMTYKQIDRVPEIKAVLSVIDQYQPDVFADMHGAALNPIPREKRSGRSRYGGHIMFEVTGSAYSNYANRPWDWRVIERMIAAGVEAGYGSDRFEADHQQEFFTVASAPVNDRFWLGRPKFYTAQYAYAKYHTMLSCCEVGWEESGVARLKGLLRIGNEVWQGEPYSGYPVNRIRGFASHFVMAYGQTAVERRRSRVELWNRQEGISQAMLYPQTDTRDTYIVAVTDEATKLLDTDKDKFVTNLGALPDFNIEAIARFVQFGPEPIVTTRPQPSPKDNVQHGMAIRLRIPYRNPQLVDLRLNGHRLQESATDGYQTWYADGFTQVHINIPPEKTRLCGMFVVTCPYRPGVQRKYGWKPPEEVLRRLRDRGKKDG